MEDINLLNEMALQKKSRNCLKVHVIESIYIHRHMNHLAGTIHTNLSFEGSSRDPQMIYEVGKCLCNAVVREWATVLCPQPLDAAAMPESKPYQLLCFLLQWVASVGAEV